ncbi:MAG: DUF1707 and DUF4190 domain-containing protein [Micromonosporaceae bacterium]
MTIGHGQDLTSGPYGGARVSDADRERAVDVLRAAFAEGRLTRDEHGTRVERAYGARTYAELAAVSADLPAGPLGTLSSQGPGALTAYVPAARQRTNPLAVASLVCGLIPGIPQIAAIILGIEAHRQIRRTGERGAALATTGLALSVVGLVLAALVVFVF